MDDIITFIFDFFNFKPAKTLKIRRGAMKLSKYNLLVLLRSSVIIFLLMLAFEFFNDHFFTELLNANIVTALFATAAGVVAGYFILSHFEFLHRRIQKKYDDSKKLEKALLTSEERYRLVFEHAVDSLVLVDVESGGFVDFNIHAYQSLGYSYAEFENLDFESFRRLCRGGDLRACISTAGGGSSSGNGLSSFETKFLTKSGVTIDVSVKTNMIELNGRKYLLLLWKDITECKQAQKQIIENNRMISTLLETIPLPVFYKSRDGRYTGCNKSFEDFLGMARDQLIGRTVFELGMPRDIAEQYFRKDNELFENPGQQIYQWVVSTNRAGIRDVIFYKATLLDSENRVSGLVGVILDITKQKKLQEATERTRDALLSQNKILVEWTAPDFLYHEDITASFRNIIEKMAAILDVERVGIWIYNEDYSRIYCIDLFERSKGLHSRGDELTVGEYPGYFKALKSQRIIATNDAREDSRTREFTDSFLLPNNITSMMDVPLNVAGKNVGIVCFEHVGEPRQWTLEQQNFAISVSNIMSMMMEISKHRQTEKELTLSRNAFNSIVEKSTAAILISDMKGRIIFINPKAECFFKSKVNCLLGEHFICPVEPGKTAEIDICRTDGTPGKGFMNVISTYWKERPAYLIMVHDPAEFKAGNGTVNG